MANVSPRILTVENTVRLTPHMQRITFGGAGLAGFPEDSDSAYLKLVFTSPSEAPMALRSRIRRYLGRKSFAVRSYTVRRYDPVARRLDIDFVLHDHSGVASSWARGAKVGDVLPAHGPGPKKLVGMGADWFLIIGDMSALPAISTNLERLPPTARGYALIEILDEADRQELDAPPGMGSAESGSSRPVTRCTSDSRCSRGGRSVIGAPVSGSSKHSAGRLVVARATRNRLLSCAP